MATIKVSVAADECRCMVSKRVIIRCVRTLKIVPRLDKTQRGSDSIRILRSSTFSPYTTRFLAVVMSELDSRFVKKG
jgi:hypothetical protein